MALSANDDKRIILDDGIRTRPIGYGDWEREGGRERGRERGRGGGESETK